MVGGYYHFNGGVGEKRNHGVHMGELRDRGNE